MGNKQLRCIYVENDEGEAFLDPVSIRVEQIYK
jgi:hypothetical protein